MLVADKERRDLSPPRRLVLFLASAIVLLGLCGEGLGSTALGAQPAGKSGAKAVAIPVEGMACIACAASVKRTLKAIDGVSDVEVNLGQRRARVTYAPDKVAPDRLVAAIKKLGYRAGTPQEVE